MMPTEDTLPTEDTVVGYPQGSVAGSATVLHTQALPGGRWAVLLDSTVFHPLEAGWPDQCADRGTLSAGGRTVQVLDAVLAGTDGAALQLGADIPVRKGTEGWAFVVAHIVAAGGVLEPGTAVELSVDVPYRHALSVGHTACHLASLALNRALAPRWGKDARADALGAPDFDAAAIVSSTITENGAVDVFRLNKSLRRKGFRSEALSAELPALTGQINATLAQWVAADAPIRIDCEGPRLTDRRYWVASLPEGEASIACGGTHVESLAELGRVGVDFALEEGDGTAVLTMATRCST